MDKFIGIVVVLAVLGFIGNGCSFALGWQCEDLGHIAEQIHTADSIEEELDYSIAEQEALDDCAANGEEPSYAGY